MASFWVPDYLPQSAWQAHAPFAFWLTQAIKPRRFVELGTHSGMSFFAFCQAVQRLRLETSATAIDTWKGDPQAGFYGEDVYRQVAAHTARYSDFAHLVRSTFDAALSQFDDGSVDLLHIDGLHDYDSVKHDFESWLPKLTEDAVVLFHDTQERKPGFGVWRFFEEQSAAHPSFHFDHGHGLGILCPGRIVPDGIKPLVTSDVASSEATRQAYALLGKGIQDRWRDRALRNGIDALLEPDSDLSDDALEALAKEADGLILTQFGRLLAMSRAGMSAYLGHWTPDAMRQEGRPVGNSDMSAVPTSFIADLRADAATMALLRRALMARKEQVQQLQQAIQRNDAKSDLLRAAYAGLVGQVERDRAASKARQEELVCWGQGRRMQIDNLTSGLNAEMRVRLEAETRLLEAERSRLWRISRKMRRLLGRQRPSVQIADSGDAAQKKLERDIRSSGLFDEAFYRASNPDLGAAVIDLTAHFATMGWWEGRRPNPTFDPVYYLSANSDVRELGINPLVHYAEQGIIEGRAPSHVTSIRRWSAGPEGALSAEQEADIAAVLDTGMFDRAFYNIEYADVAESGLDPVVHYALEGWQEGRRPNADFDPQFYLQTYRDVAERGLNPLVHYASAGIVEGRFPSRRASLAETVGRGIMDGQDPLVVSLIQTGLFDIEFYLASNPDVASSGSDPALHFATVGWREGRWPNAYFDPQFYLDNNHDVLASGINPLMHFAGEGIFEGRLPSALRNQGTTDAEYARWVVAHDTLTDADRRAMRARLVRLAYKPLISIILPVYDTPIQFLREAVASVQSQVYGNWELCIADDASPNPDVRDLLRELAQSDGRIKVVERQENGHISAASNSAIALAEGEFLALLDHDDVLPDHALFEVVHCLNERPNLDLIYSDEDHLDPSGTRTSPYFKSDYNPDLMLGHNMISHLGVYRTSLVRAIGGFRIGYEGSQDYDLALRVIDATTPAKIYHIPAVLYHWRSTDGQATFSQAFQDRCIASARRALADHLERRGEVGSVVAHPLVKTWHRVRRPVPHPAPLVSIIIPTKDKAEILAPCCAGILERTDYPNFELIVVDHQSTEPETLALLADLAEDERVTILPYEGVFNYAAINNAAVRQAKGSILAFVNNDVDVIAPDWLSEMVALANLPEVGVVGAKLLYPDGRVQHAGVVLGAGGVAGHAFHLINSEDPGVMGRAAMTTTISAVTGACLVVEKSLFEQVGGFDADNLAVAFNDVDLCIKVRETGARNVLTPHALLYHHESLSRGMDLTPEKQARFSAECDFMTAKWGDLLTSDPFYNSNLTLRSADYGLAWPPRRKKPWAASPST